MLAEWAARTSCDEVTIYTRDASVHDFVQLPNRTQIIERPRHPGNTWVDELWRLARSPHDGARLAAEIDRAGHDVAFCFASRLTQAPDVLPFLQTPHLFYSPEPLRSAYEPVHLTMRVGARAAATRLGLNPLQTRRSHLDRRYLGAARRIVTHSHFAQSMLQRVYGVHPEIVRLGVDAEVFTPPPGDVPREGYVLSVGALHPLKGHELVIEALATMPRPRVRLVVIADRGESAEKLHELAHARGVELHLRLRASLTDVVAAYRRAGVVACAQIRESFGLVPLEAMACATPVVAVDEGGLRESVIDRQTGLLTPRDAHAFGKAIARVLADHNLASRLGSSGRQIVLDEWNWAQTAAHYDRLLAESAAT